jgi:hypothetical protein
MGKKEIMERSYILNGNLQIALRMAIECREKEEKTMGHTSDSALVAGWKENLEALKERKLEIK